MGGSKDMQDLGPDMDDLLRRASAGYPLKEPADDWDKIASRLPEEPIPAITTDRPSNNKRMFWLLLLLIPGAIMYGVLTQETDKDIHTSTVNKEAGQGNKKAIDKAKTFTEIASSQKTKIQEADISGNASQKHGAVLSESAERTNAANASNESLNTSTNKNIFKANQLKAFNGSTHLNEETAGYFGYEQKNSLQQNIFASGFTLKKLHSVRNVNQMKFEPYAKHISVSPPSFPSITTSNPDSSYSNINKTRKKYFYYGITGGAGFSAVNSNGLQKMGYDFGFFGGYRFSRLLSLETGVLATQKYYTTTGEDFSTDKLGDMMQPGMQMMEVEGSNQGISIPLHVKLDLTTKKQNRFFVKTGFSSLIMTKESNYYHTMMNGNPDMIKGVYKDNKNYLAATIDFTAGYEQKIKDKFYLRIEPYIQIPIRQIGVGNLPVTSTGLHIGLSRPAH